MGDVGVADETGDRGAQVEHNESRHPDGAGTDSNPPAAQEPVFQVEDLDRGAEPLPQQRLRRQQRDIEGRRPINFDEVALREILDPRRVEWQHSPPPSMFLNCSKQPDGARPVNHQFRRGPRGAAERSHRFGGSGAKIAHAS